MTSRFSWIVFAFAVLALFIAPLQLTDRPQRLPSETNLATVPRLGDFLPNGVYSTTPRDALPANVATFGSWVESDAFQGASTTPWFSTSPKITVMVAGYPTLPGNRLEIEFRRSDSSLERRPFTAPNPGEQW